MKETIYTIPVNEAFEVAYHSDEPAHKKDCPFCALFRRLEENEIDLIMGASMMEPDVRIRTNKQGFCPRHFGQMFTKGNRLGLALILESHLAEIIGDIAPPKVSLVKDNGSSAVSRIEKLNHSCYVCGRIEYALTRMMSTAVLLWENDSEFRKKFAAQGWFCLPHFSDVLSAARAEMGKKTLPDFIKAANEIEMAYLKELNGDVSWFAKKFDYNYQDEPYYNSRDSVERALKMLNGCE